MVKVRTVVVVTCVVTMSVVGSYGRCGGRYDDHAAVVDIFAASVVVTVIV